MTGWAVVDDEELVRGNETGLMLQVLQSRFVRTNAAIGMTSRDADKLIEIILSDGDEDGITRERL